MIQLYPFKGIVTSVHDIEATPYGNGCVKMISVQNEEGQQVNFILSPSTYVVNQEMLVRGDKVTGYYDANAPAILIYPAQYTALVMVKEPLNHHVKVSSFNDALVSQDGQLQLNIQSHTQIRTPNGQMFTKSLINQNLIVFYRASTKSIPAQTIPSRVIVLC